MTTTNFVLGIATAYIERQGVVMGINKGLDLRSVLKLQGGEVVLLTNSQQQNMDKKFGVFSSSTNSQELSLTITSIVKIIGLLIGSYASMKGVDAVITEPQLELISNAVIAISTAVLTIVQSGELIFGIVRKVLASLNS